MIAFSAAITAAAASAPRKPLTAAPGTIHAATSSAAAEMIHATMRCSGLSFGRLGRQLGASWACSRLLTTGAHDCFVRACGGPHPKGVMKVAAPGYSIGEDVV